MAIKCITNQILIGLALSAMLLGCVGGTPGERRERRELQRQNVDEQFRDTSPGLLQATLGGGVDPEQQINVNRHLWTASIDVLSFLPIEQADPFSGLLVTGWGNAPGGSSVYRATVLVRDAALDASSLKLALFRRQGGRSVPVSGEVAEKIEDAILTRARQIRIGAEG